jgi:serine/threonine-protein kinase
MGIIHRDIKPANMMLTETGTLKVMDFGIARVLGTSRMTRQGNIVGTIEYMSPEQVRGQETDARSDIYSLGILLYEMLTGRVPFSSDSEYDLMQMQIETAPQPPRVFYAQIPQAVEQAIMRSLAKRSEARFQGAGEFRNALLSALGSAPTVVVARPAASSEPTRMIGSPVIAPPVQGIAPGETRLAAPIPAGSHGDQMKQTRLVGEGNAPFAYGANQPGSIYAPPPGPAPAGSNAKLFIGIAVALLVVMMGAAAVVYTVLMKPAVKPTAPASMPAQTTSPAPSPSAGGGAGAGQPSIPAPPPPQSNPPVDLARPSGDTLSGGSVPSRENANAGRAAKPVSKESSAEAAARKERERKAAEARRLLNQ